MASSKFLQRVSLEKARKAATACTRLCEVEHIPAESALARITAEPVFARLDSPHYRASAMDGIAVRSADLSSASSETPLTLTETAVGDTPLATDQPVCAPVDTGSPLPEWADTVVRIEDTKTDGTKFVVSAPISAGRDVRPIGEDIEAGALLFGAGHAIRPYDIGAMLAAGLPMVAVRRQPTVAMLATGSEVIEPGDERELGKVVEYNSRVMSAYVREWGGKPVYLGRVADEREALTRAIVAAAREHDIVTVIAGSSVGRRDFTVDVLAASGTLLVHGVDMMPGKPASIASIEGTPVIGIPGYPVSAVVTYQQLLAPVIAATLGITPATPQTIEAHVRRKIPSRLGVEEFIRVCVARDDDGYIVSPLPRGAGSITTLVRADAILRIGANNEGLDAGSLVRLELLRSSSELEHSIVVASRPDVFAATLESVAKRGLAGLRFAHVGLSTYDTIMAMERGEIELGIVEIVGQESERELVSLLHARLDGCTAYRIRSKGADNARVIVIGPSLCRRDCGRLMLSVLAGNTFSLELETVEEFTTGLAVKRIAPA
jgi:putative molybdopterin biosynthesis protein